MPEFSVIIPLFNKANFIEAAIKSVLEQEFTDYELIIVNDASTDSSLRKVENFKDEKIKVYQNKENKGLSATRNIGITKANGNIIALLDADDTWQPKHLQHIFLLSKKYPEAAIFGTNWVEKINNSLVETKKNIPIQEEHFLLNNFFTASLKQPLVCPSSLAFKTEIIRKIGGFNENIQVGEDTDFLIRANLKFKFAYHNKVSCIYTLYSENQITAGVLGNKTIPDFFSFEKNHSGDIELKKFLDFQRYTYVLKYKLEDNKDCLNKITAEINLKNLNKRQQFLLKSPRSLYVLLKKIKFYLLKNSVRISSF